MIDPFNGGPVNDEPRGRGLGVLKGSSSLDLPPLPGDFPPGEAPLPGNRRFAGDKIKGIAQLDPTIFAKLFP